MDRKAAIVGSKVDLHSVTSTPSLLCLNKHGATALKYAIVTTQLFGKTFNPLRGHQGPFHKFAAAHGSRGLFNSRDASVNRVFSTVHRWTCIFIYEINHWLMVSSTFQGKCKAAGVNEIWSDGNKVFLFWTGTCKSSLVDDFQKIQRRRRRSNVDISPGQQLKL